MKETKLIGFAQCIEHQKRTRIHWHHVVPKSKGGKMMVPLCTECHEKVHDMKSSNLVKKIIRQQKAEGRYRGGRPTEVDHKEVLRLRLDEGLSVKEIAAYMGVSHKSLYYVLAKSTKK